MYLTSSEDILVPSTRVSRPIGNPLYRTGNPRRFLLVVSFDRSFPGALDKNKDLLTPLYVAIVGDAKHMRGGHIR